MNTPPHDAPTRTVRRRDAGFAEQRVQVLGDVFDRRPLVVIFRLAQAAPIGTQRQAPIRRSEPISVPMCRPFPGRRTRGQSPADFALDVPGCRSRAGAWNVRARSRSCRWQPAALQRLIRRPRRRRSRSERHEAFACACRVGRRRRAIGRHRPVCYTSSSADNARDRREHLERSPVATPRPPSACGGRR